MIIHRALITPDGTHIVSHHRHDYVDHKDTKNGKYYFLDGGLDYCRSSANGDERFLEFEKNEVPFTILRQYFERWNTFQHSYVKLKDIPDDWLQNILDYFIEYNRVGWWFSIYLEEKLYRAENEISV